MKELAEINAKGTPPGIVLLDAESTDLWVFLISVLGEETVYRVSQFHPSDARLVSGGRMTYHFRERRLH